MAAAGRRGELEGKVKWDCPKCGTSWIGETMGDVKCWTGKPFFAIHVHRTR